MSENKSVKKMTSNKENNSKPSKTRIPLPIQPMSALPKYVHKNNVERDIESETKIQRLPLKTLTHQNYSLPGPSKGSKLLLLDTRHVTVRKKRDNLDWGLTVFNNEEEASSKSVNLNEAFVDLNEEEKERKCSGLDKESHRLDEVNETVTPVTKSTLEHRCIKNIKKSLKRPHSRELQNIARAVQEHEKPGDIDNMRLQPESFQEKSLAPDFITRPYMTWLIKDYMADLYNYLLLTERKPLDIPRIKSATRACVVNWVMKVNGVNGNPAIVQTACWYLDSILGTGNVQPDNLQLIAAACFWIAQKLHGHYLSASKLVTYASFAFSSKRLVAAEQAILSRLKFPPLPVVPQDYISYLAWWCDNENPEEIELAASFMCMSGLLVDKSLCEDFPSVIAVAAVRNVFLLYQRKDLLTRLKTCSIYTSAEQKAPMIARTCAILRRSVRTVATLDYEYKAPYAHYDAPPLHIAQKIVNYVFDLGS